MAFESTQAILGINEDQRAKRDSTWKKLMDIASLGSNIWGTVSGRKFSREERIGGEQADLNKLSMGHLYNMEALGKKLENDKNFQIFKVQNPDLPKEQLYAMYLQSPEGQAFQDNQALRDTKAGEQEHGWRMQEVAAGTGRSASEERRSFLMGAIKDGLTNALGTNPGWFMPNPADPSGESMMPNPATIEELRSNILKAIGVYQPTPEELRAVTPYLESLLAGKAGVAVGEVKKDPALRLRELNDRLVALAKTGESLVTPQDISRLDTTVPIIGQKGKVSEPGWFGAERDLESNLQSIIPSLEDPIEKELTELMLRESKKNGKLQRDTYVQYLSAVRSLMKRLGKYVPPAPPPDKPELRTLPRSTD